MEKKEFRILWVDDDWGSNERSIKLNTTSEALARALSLLGFILRLTSLKTSNISDVLIRESKAFDLMILDYELSENKADNGVALLDIVMRSFKASKIPPTFFYTQYPEHLLESATSRLRNKPRIFDKDETVTFINAVCNIARSRPLKFVVLSDVHLGFINSKNSINASRMWEAIEDAMRTIRREEQIDALICCGDFAWANQAVELRDAGNKILQLQSWLELDSGAQVFFCPGNHDLDFSNPENMWVEFAGFIKQLSVTDKSYLDRFFNRQHELNNRTMFPDQSSLVSLVHNPILGTLVLGLNSNRPTGEGHGVAAEIDANQWNAIRRQVSQYGEDLLRIAIVHHPIFHIPGGDYKDNEPVLEQATTIQNLAALGFTLVIHGHAHSCGISTQKFCILNSPGASASTDEHLEPGQITTISCPTLTANPSSTTPFRQFLIVSIGGVDDKDGGRSISLQTKVFDPNTKSWRNAQGVPDGIFSVSSNKKLVS